MNHTSRLALTGVLFLVGCVAPAPGDPGGDDGVGGGGDGDGTTTQAAEVFANSESTLYRLDVLTKTLTKIGLFDCISLTPDVGDSQDGMTDIAADASGALFGVGRKLGTREWMLFSIDRASAHCTALEGVLGNNVGGLSFTPAGVLDSGRETLVGLAVFGQLQRFDMASGSSTAIGTLAGWHSKSADLVSISGDRTYSTNSQSGGDHLVVIDPKTGATVQDIGSTGIDLFGGLGYWGGTVYGFSWDGRLFAISTQNAATTEITIPNREPDLRFVGAAVTTSAPSFL